MKNGTNPVPTNNPQSTPDASLTPSVSSRNGCRDILVACLILGFLIVGIFFTDTMIRGAKTKILIGNSNDLPQELSLTGMVRPDVFHMNEMYELTITNKTGKDLHHPVIEVNGVEQPLPKYEDNFLAGASCDLFFNHDWSNLKQGWSQPRADGHLYPITVKFRSDETSGIWSISIEQK